MPKYDSQTRAIMKYDTETYDRILLKVRKGLKGELKKLADADGVSLNRYILTALEEKSGLKLTLDNALPWISSEE